MTLYHGCDEGTSTKEDFVPYALSAKPGKRRRGIAAGCIGYGLSVWTSEKAARDAQRLFPAWHGIRHIHKGDVDPTHGRLRATPTQKDKTHHTFWCYENIDIGPLFSWAWAPSVGHGS